MAEITLKECTDYNWFERRILGWHWWWSAYIPYGDSCAGFARTRDKARARAEKAARRLAWLESTPYERYQYEVKPGD
ncbi:hypothetical protein ACIP79_00560 [Streptomyces sp. NPDC088747]|uniref:hypothetical protein n=1 Tax=Streptomyces sp. NPDC088747 TaxID=3365886 RepID=UPI00380EFF02